MESLNVYYVTQELTASCFFPVLPEIGLRLESQVLLEETDKKTLCVIKVFLCQVWTLSSKNKIACLTILLASSEALYGSVCFYIPAASNFSDFHKCNASHPGSLLQYQCTLGPAKEIDILEVRKSIKILSAHLWSRNVYSFCEWCKTTKLLT